MRLIEEIWTGESVRDRIARAALTPFEGVYRGAAALRRWLYDRGALAVESSPIAVVSIGNLSVGGTGKTPVSAWIAAKLASQGRSPAIVLRGYGGDEALVHSRINPGIPVVVSVDRAAGVRHAADMAADVAVLDDAFQHRKAFRDLDIVLVSADDWDKGQRLLPAGPYREPMSGLRRASLVIITRKSATDEQVESVRKSVGIEAPFVPIAVLRLELSDVVRETPPSGRMPVGMLSEKRIAAVAAVGNPTAFFRQLESLGAFVVPMAFADHHAFTTDDISTIIRNSAGCEYVVCTLKDAVKLSPVWPATKTPLWYVSLAVHGETGEPAIDELLMRLKGRIAVN